MIYVFLDFELDTQLYELRRGMRPIALEPQVYDVLAYLVQNQERVVPKHELLERLWPDRYVSDGALSHCVMLARKALGDSGQDQRCIKTVHRRGYRFLPRAHKQLERDEEVARERTHTRSSSPGLAQLPS
jgi:DNA-binding winged helix-turn-helix (wHTH) protein